MARTPKTEKTAGVIGYTRVSTDEQATSGLGLDAQSAAIQAECARRGLSLLGIVTDAGLSAKNLHRPALAEALARLDAGQGDALMFSKVDRLTRSVHDLTGLMQRAERTGWGLIALDMAVDTTTPQGAAMAQVLAVFAELERRLIGQRTREALAVKKAQGIALGRPVAVAASVVDRIRADHRNGIGFSTIARALNDEGVPTAQGGAKWYPATVRNIALASYVGAEAA